MKLYTSLGPNPRVVRMFAAEKGLAIPTETVDIVAGANRQPPYLARNRSGTTPALELEDGRTVCEITAICEYLEELHPAPPLIGTTADERAETRMWVRRIDLGIAEPITNAFRSTGARALFAPRMRLLSEEGGAQLREIAYDKLRWIDGELAGRSWVCGDRFTLADIMLYAFLDMARDVGPPLPEGLDWVPAFLDRAAARPSAEA